MLLSLKDLIPKHSITIKGVIHVGAHYGEEYEEYVQAGVTDSDRMHFIEPCKPAYNILLQKLIGKAQCYNVACGNYFSKAVMHTEQRNHGQSNSLLKPAKHVDQYPDIRFTGTETVNVVTLDSLQIKNCNFLNMDTQGAELLVLKGAIDTLAYMDYIYTEVNKTEMYEHCAHIDEMDAFLEKYGFHRAETGKWVNDSWTDALYVRNKNNSVTEKDSFVPKIFRPESNVQYPHGNTPMFEQWYFENHTEHSPLHRQYLPVFWTPYYVNNNYGKDKKSITELQKFIDRLDPEKKYYTIVQYDDGILNDLSRLDIKVFAMSGPRIDYPLPLLCHPHPYTFHNKRDLLCNFIGRNTHPVRKELLKEFGNPPDCFISTLSHTVKEYCEIMSRSVFTLCPRGYGKTSFRICEALQYGSIPVYISDSFIIPHDEDFADYGVIINTDLTDMSDIYTSLLQMDEKEIIRKQKRCFEVYRSYYTFESNKILIERNI